MDKDQVAPREPFGRLSRWAARRAGHGYAFLGALLVVLVWAAAGPFLGFSNRWQLAINTTTTIVTFLMVFLIQNSQTRDSEALHIKLDELIESTKGARRELLDLEDLPEEELHRLQMGYEALAREARAKRQARRPSAGRGRPGRGKREKREERPTPKVQ